jgi:hypothetical protein
MRKVILEYKEPIPDKIKTIIERAIKITFDGCDIRWISDKRIVITNYKLGNIHVNI